MPSVGIITFLHNENYGSTLQAYALQTLLRQEGYEACHIDYRPSSRQKLRNLLRSGNSPSLLLDGVRKRLVKRGEQGARAKAASFGAFYREHMALTPPCPDPDALRKEADRFDLLLCGSDQIWSPVWLDPAYFFDWARPGQPRVAYAPSLGVSRMPSARKAEKLRRLIAPFSSLSVREEEGAALLRPLTDRPVAVLPDPVCLLTREDWRRLARPYAHQGPYIAVYLIGDRESYRERVEAVSRETGLPVVIIPVTAAAYAWPYEKASGLSPEGWLGVLDGAARVITDSFHGALFSLILGKELTLLRRYREDDPASKNSRVDNLFRQLGITDPDAVDRERVDLRLAALREQGVTWLLDALRRAAP